MSSMADRPARVATTQNMHRNVGSLTSKGGRKEGLQVEKDNLESGLVCVDDSIFLACMMRERHE